MKHLLSFLKQNFVYIQLGIILAVGGIGSVLIVDNTDRQMRAGLLDQAYLVTQALNVENIQSLTGTIGDLASPNYLHIKQMLAALRAAGPKYRFLYLMGRKSDGAIFFFADSEPSGSPNYSPPGQIYSEASNEDHRVFDTRAAILEGPVSDRGGTWVSALVPLTDPASGEVIAVAGIDIAENDWYWNIATGSALPVGLLLAVLILVLTYYRLQRTNKLIRSQQNKLLDSEKQFRSMFLDHSAVMMLLDPQSGRILDANSAASRFYGYSREQLKSMSMVEINTLDPNQLAIERARATHLEKNYFNFQHKLASGEIREVESYTTPITSGGETVLFSIAIDITARKQAEEALLNERLLLRTLIDNIPDSIYMLDLAGRKTLVNLAEVRFTGAKSEAEVLGKDNFDIYPQELAEKFFADDQSVMQTGIPVVNREEYILDENAHKRWLLTSKFPLRDRNSQITGLVGIGRDITERKQAEFSLHESAARFQSLFEDSPISLWEEDYSGVKQRLENLRTHGVADFNTYLCQHPEVVEECAALVKVIDVNKATLDLYGAASKEDMVQNLATFFFKESQDQFRDELVLLAGGATHFEMEVINQTLDGKRKTLNLNWVVIPGYESDLSNTIVSIIDITERKLVEEQLKNTNLQLEEAITRANTLAVQAELASVAKSEFLANMSHEIRTPMNGVIGMTGLLLDTDLDEEQRRYTEIVRSSSESLLTLINDILDFSKIEARKMELETLDFDLLSLLDDLAGSMSIRAQEKGVELLCAADPDVPAMLRGDPGRLRQILTNLVGNAIKFTQHGEVALRVACLSASKDEVELRFSIRDTGIGIPADKIGSLFTKFTQVDASTTRQFGGTGLGLAISKQLAELMDGKIGVNSQEGQGSEFWFTGHLKLQPEGILKEMPTLARLNGIRILVVDDNATSREILIVRLASWGMRPAEAVDGLAALIALEAAVQQGDPFTVAVLDMQMPGLDGAMLGQTIKAHERLAETHLILLSSFGERGDARRFEQIGFEGYLNKPLHHADLFNVLSAALSGGPSPDQKHSIVTRHSARETLRMTVGPGTRILLVEDNSTNQKVALGILQKLGLKGDAVANGAEAVKALESIPYDLVLMDVQMPVMDGMEATRHIRDLRSAVLNHQLPIIAMTAHALQGDRERCLEAGMNDYVSKPVDPQALAEAIERWLSGSNRSDPPPVKAKTASLEAQPKVVQTPVFDKVSLMQRLMGDEELAHTVITGFLEDIPDQIRALKECLKAEDISGAERQVHTIKGAAANIGGEALRAVAFEMEKNGKKGDLPAIHAHMGELEMKFERLREALNIEIQDSQKS